MNDAAIARALARTLIAGDASAPDLLARAARLFGRNWPWMPSLTERYLAVYAGRTRPRAREVERFLLTDDRFRAALSRHSARLRIEQWTAEEARMQPRGAAAAWSVPALVTEQALANWFHLEPNDLEWFAGLNGLRRKVSNQPALEHYHYRLLTKRSGSIRLIESPKQQVKRMQRQVLHEILSHVPALPAVHGFTRGRSIQSFAAPHIGQHMVLRMDLQDFFPTIRRARVQTIFRMLGYPERVADLLGGICTNAAPRSLFRTLDPNLRQELRTLYESSHLPQGAPSSPALANLCCYRLDCRLAGLARAAGAAYTRYADDLAFSGGPRFARGADRFAAQAAAIAAKERLSVNFRKTRVMRQGVQQHLAGLVVNQHLNVPRKDFDSLKALLTNCVRHGLESQNHDHRPAFRAHLAGRVSFIASVHPARGRKLHALLEAIEAGT